MSDTRDPRIVDIPVDISKDNQSLKLSQFCSKQPKPGGLRLGAIGTFNDLPDLYLMKKNQGGYDTLLTKEENDMVVIECLSANLIMEILGETYAAETTPVEVDCTTVDLHNKYSGQLVTYPLNCTKTSNYALASKILQSDIYDIRSLPELPPKMCYLSLTVAASILEITDIKEDHFIQYTKKMGDYTLRCVALIDCAGALDGLTKKTLDEILKNKIPFYRFFTPRPVDYGIVLNILQNFVKIDVDALLQPYQNIEVSDFCKPERLKALLQAGIEKMNSNIIDLMHLIKDCVSQNTIKLDNYEFCKITRTLETFPQEFRYGIACNNPQHFWFADEVTGTLDLLSNDNERYALVNLLLQSNESKPLEKNMLAVLLQLKAKLAVNISQYSPQLNLFNPATSVAIQKTNADNCTYTLGIK